MLPSAWKVRQVDLLPPVQNGREKLTKMGQRADCPDLDAQVNNLLLHVLNPAFQNTQTHTNIFNKSFLLKNGTWDSLQLNNRTNTIKLTHESKHLKIPNPSFANVAVK